MKIGDIVRFSNEHTSQGGHEYTKGWIGIVVSVKTVGNHVPIDEVKIMWRAYGKTQISHYDEIWWNDLGYEPFEVVSESR